MLNKNHKKDQTLLNQINSPIIIRKTSNSATQKASNSFEPQSNLHALAGFPMRSQYKSSSDGHRREAILSSREASIDQIKAKLKEYLRKTQENSLLNYQNQSLPEFNRKSIHENFRMTLFRNNLKKRINLKIIQNALPERYESSPEFNVSEALINPRAQKHLQDNGKVFHPKREYFIHHHHQRKKQKIPIPQMMPTKTVYPLTNRESSYRERERGGLGVEPWRRWARESEEGDIGAPEDI